jgi:hypothetical protein
MFNICPGDSSCYPYGVEEREGVGRILVATRDISPGDIIFREKELVVGPSKGTEPVCIGQLTILNSIYLMYFRFTLSLNELEQQSKEESKFDNKVQNFKMVN